MTSARQPESAAALHGRQPLSLPTLPNLGLEVQGVRLWSHHRVTVPRSNGSRYFILRVLRLLGRVPQRRHLQRMASDHAGGRVGGDRYARTEMAVVFSGSPLRILRERSYRLCRGAERRYR
jgi:hypothetical protein